MKSPKLTELVEEFRTVFSGRGRLIDSLVPTVLFVIAQAIWTLEHAVWGAIVAAVILAGIRLARRESVLHALGGLAGVIVAAAIAGWMSRAEGYFLPSIVSGGLSVVACLLSLVAGRPLVAWTSYLARRWPLNWYWHPRVKPAYSHVTVAWAAYFSLRLLLQLYLLRYGSTEIIALLNAAMGWPSTIVLLVISYMYGIWKLGRLRGPSVDEFRRGADPPWMGQQRGF
jgi:hypothetical protein